MSHGFTVQERLPFPVQVIWTYITDMELSHTWIKGVNGMTPLVQGVEDCVGARYQATMTTRGRASSREVEILAWEPNHRFSLASRDGGVSAVYEYLLRRRGEESTDMTLNATCTARGPWTVALPLISYMMKRHDKDQLILLRRAMESTSENMDQYFDLVS